MQKEIDSIDLQILSMLNEGKSSIKITEKLNFTRTALHYRLKKLQTSKILTGKTPKINLKGLGYNVTAMINITAKKGMVYESVKPFRKHKSICSIYGVTGKYDLVLLTKFKTIEELNSLVKEIMASEYVERSNTSIVLDNIKEDILPTLS